MNPLEIRNNYVVCDLNVPYHGEEKLADRLKGIYNLQAWVSLLLPIIWSWLWGENNWVFDLQHWVLLFPEDLAVFV